MGKTYMNTSTSSNIEQLISQINCASTPEEAIAAITAISSSSSPTQNCYVEVSKGAGEQGSRGEICSKSFPPAPLPRSSSADHNAKFPWRTTRQSEALSSVEK